jgi:hypothetical protein
LTTAPPPARRIAGATAVVRCEFPGRRNGVGLGPGIVDDDVRASRGQQLRNLFAHAGAAPVTIATFPCRSIAPLAQCV